eukprot:388050_1
MSNSVLLFLGTTVFRCSFTAQGHAQIYSPSKEMEPKEYFEGDGITFRDIAIGFVEKIQDTKMENTPLTKRELVIHRYCEKQLKCEAITELSQIRDMLVFLCKIVIRVKYHKLATLRDEQSSEFKSDLLPIVQWIWYEKMKEKEMNILAFAQNMSAWIHETGSAQ